MNRRSILPARFVIGLTFGGLLAVVLPAAAATPAAHLSDTQTTSRASVARRAPAARKTTQTQTSHATAKSAIAKSAAAKQATVKKPAVKKSASGKKRPATRYSAKASQTRRAKIARARAAALARENALPRFKTDEDGNVVPDVHAAAAIIYNPETNQVLWEANSQDKRSIASITKVMTATVFIESEPDMTATVTVERADVRAASTTHLRANETISVDDLFHLLLIASDNAAARVLARVSPWGSEGFVEKMNEKAEELGLASTSYSDPSGLDPDNVSSAYDMARLISYAGTDERISSVMRLPEYTVHTSRRSFDIRSTNRLVRAGDLDVLGGKTGFISKAGYCLATLLELPAANQPIAVVVLGARSNTGRFTETRNLFQWLSSKAQQLFEKKNQQ